MRNYCGGILEKNPPFNATLVQMKDGSYGTKNLYCRWNAINQDSLRYISVNFTKFHPALNDQYALEVQFSDGRTTNYTLQSSSFLISLQFVQNVYFHYFTAESKVSEPFNMEFEMDYDSSSNYLGLFISLGIIVFLCVVCTIIFYKCSRMIIDNSNRRMLERLNRAGNNHSEHEVITGVDRDDPQRREDELKRANWQTLTLLFQSDLSPIRYSPFLNEFGSNCTICLEDFKIGTQVTKLITCKHIFHTRCLKNWCEKILLQPKCPNCNEMIIPGMKNTQVEDVPEIQVMHLNSGIQDSRIRDVVDVQDLSMSKSQADSSQQSEPPIRRFNGHFLFVNRNMNSRHNDNELNDLAVINVASISSRRNNSNRDEDTVRNNFIPRT